MPLWMNRGDARKTIRVDGDKKLLRKLGNLAGYVETRVIRNALRVSHKIVLKEAKALCPVETGLLKKSLGSAMTTYYSGVVAVAIGARMGWGRDIGKDESGKLIALTTKKRREKHKAVDYRNPTKYIHLVELGTKRTSPKPFMRRAFDNTANAVVKKTAEECWKGIAKEAKKAS